MICLVALPHNLISRWVYFVKCLSQPFMHQFWFNVFWSFGTIKKCYKTTWKKLLWYLSITLKRSQVLFCPILTFLRKWNCKNFVKSIIQFLMVNYRVLVQDFPWKRCQFNGISYFLPLFYFPVKMTQIYENSVKSKSSNYKSTTLWACCKAYLAKRLDQRSGVASYKALVQKRI